MRPVHALSCSFLALLPVAAGAATIDVPCDVADLKAALVAVETNPDAANTIALAEGCTYTLTTVDNEENNMVGANGLPRVTRPQTLLIDGNGATIERSSAALTPEFRVLQFGVQGAPLPDGNLLLTIRELTVSNGRIATALGSPPFRNGGGMNFRGDPGDVLALEDVTFSGNHADSGGGLVAASFQGGIGANLQDVRFTGNSAFVSGAGLQLEQATATLEGLLVSGNTLNPDGNSPNNGWTLPFERGEGGAVGIAIFMSPTLTLTDSVIEDNTGRGIGGGGVGVIGSSGSIRNTRIRNNSIAPYLLGASAGRGGDGGGLVALEGFFTGVTLDVEGSAILGNSATGKGGGIAIAGSATGGPTSTVRIFNTTVSGNSAQDSAGGIAIGGADTLLANVTVTGNTARYAGGVGVGHYDYDSLMMTDKVTVGVARFVNTIIGGNDATDATVDTGDCAIEAGTATDGGGVMENLFSLVQLDAPAAPVDLRCSAVYPFALVADPLLGPLADNGGPDFSHEPLTGSPVLDAGSTAALPLDFTLDFDQRGAGFPRVVAAGIDLGAIEKLVIGIFADGFED